MDIPRAAVPAWRWSWIPLLYLQAALMHPCFSDSQLARITRILVAPIIAYTALTVYQHTLARPVELNVAINISAVGAACSAFAMLSIQLAFTRGPWYRLDDSAAPKKSDASAANGNGATEAEASLDKKANPSFLELAAFSHDMIHNSRNIGWSTRFPERILPRPSPESPWRFALRKIPTVVTLQFIMVGASSILVPAGTIRGAAKAWTYWTGKQSTPLIEAVAPPLVTVLFGLSAWAGISLNHALASAVVAVATQTAHKLAPKLVGPFDTSRWPPLFHSPYFCTSLTQLWTTGWHSMLRRYLEFCGAKPMQFLFRPLGRSASRIAGVLGAFTISALLHEYCRYIAAGPDPTFRTFGFFFGQGLGVLVEIAWLKITGKKVGGFLGWCWALTWLVWWAMPMVDSWLEAGIQRGIPMPHEWPLTRIFVPFECVQPSAEAFALYSKASAA